ncbi:MAG: hypothetical protein GY830_03335 [Bacteroidetes bacterium]|nr:hypothetical protein [Bacteroidota bacterium]
MKNPKATVNEVSKFLKDSNEIVQTLGLNNISKLAANLIQVSTQETGKALKDGIKNYPKNLKEEFQNADRKRKLEISGEVFANTFIAAQIIKNATKSGYKLIKNRSVTNQLQKGNKFMKYQENFSLNPEWKNWKNYLKKRNWNFDDIQKTLLEGKWQPHYGKNWLNKGNSMSLVTNPTSGKSIIIDNITKDIIQLGDAYYNFK